MTLGEQVDRRIAALESKLAAARLEWTRCEAILDLCPGGRPGDHSQAMTPEAWIRWARAELGYGEGER